MEVKKTSIFDLGFQSLRRVRAIETKIDVRRGFVHESEFVGRSIGSCKILPRRQVAGSLNDNWLARFAGDVEAEFSTGATHWRAQHRLGVNGDGDRVSCLHAEIIGPDH